MDTFVQDNHSSSRRGTLRGLHYQLHRPQAKVCRAIEGEALNIAVEMSWGHRAIASLKEESPGFVWGETSPGPEEVSYSEHPRNRALLLQWYESFVHRNCALSSTPSPAEHAPGAILAA